MRHVLLASAGLATLLSACTGEGPKTDALVTGAEAPQVQTQALTPAQRQAFFGDLHLHTTNSFDAYVLMGTKTTPEDAYRFAKGETVTYLGEQVRRREPLDFLAVTDHSENLGVFNELEDPNSAVSKSALGQRVKAGLASGQLSLTARRSGQQDAISLVQEMLKPEALKEVDTKGLSTSAWRREIDAANKFYEPGKFTTFIAYEWTSMPSGQNLHRNVIFRGSDAPNPFSSADSQKPEDLWTFLAKIRAQGHEALAIPHNQNASNGIMYDWTTLDGRPIDEAYAVLRSQNEPLSEITQNKGSSDTHPSLSPNDEFANYEIFDRLLVSPQKSRPSGSYVRDALGKGLVLQQKIGVNAYKDGIIAASDLHGGLSTSAEADFGGNIGSANVGGGRPNQETAKQVLTPAGDSQSFNVTITSSGALTGVWAEQNTRESIYDAFRRKETFATSGTRLQVRFFGGWDLPDEAGANPDWAQIYAAGAPMGSDLPAKAANVGAPEFLVWALKDPNGANLDRVQVIKLWVKDGKQQEKIYDVAFDKGRKVDAKTGVLAPIGNTVDLKTGQYTNSIGSTQLSAIWRDPDFDVSAPAAYYIRVLEIPTPRWTTLLAIQNKLDLPSSVPATLQERAWSSPIWYTPAS